MNITPEQLRLRRLARQALIERVPTVEAAVHAIFTVQTQYAASLATGVAARCESPVPGWTGPALEVDGWLRKCWTVRGTLHTHDRADHRLLLGWFGRRRAAVFRTHLTHYFGIADPDGLEAEIVAALAEGPLTRQEIHDRVPALKAIPSTGWGRDVKGLAYDGRLVFVGEGADQKFALVETDLPDVSAAEVARRYLEAYGPADARDFAFWAGISAVEARAAWAAVEPACEVVECEGKRLLDLPGMAVDADPPQVRLLAKFDSITLAHRDRTFLIPSAFLKQVFRIAGQVEAVVLLDGVATGTWRVKRSGKRSEPVFEPWRRWTARETKAIDREAERMLCLM
ncbi:MAG TPA: winged helix DNA-binding domain-containing protein [Fimbriimonadaceae bacterium]|nr:winged helix DNA-binding domain-containing protein [Fimbriimonadaceae bacterium]